MYHHLCFDPDDAGGDADYYSHRHLGTSVAVVVTQNMDLRPRPLAVGELGAVLEYELQDARIFYFENDWEEEEQARRVRDLRVCGLCGRLLGLRLAVVCWLCCVVAGLLAFARVS